MSVRYNVRPDITTPRPVYRPPVPQKQVFTLETKMRSMDLVAKTLQKLYNAQITGNEDSFKVKVLKYQLEFETGKNGFYEIQYSSVKKLDEVADIAKEIELEYRGMVQDYIYNAVKAKAEAKGLALEQETVQKNQAIVLTFNLNG